MESSLYIHIPFCISKCAYCDFFSMENHNDLILPYVDSLCNEIRHKKKLYKITSWKTVYIGGGTPSLLKYFELKKIRDAVFENCLKSKDFEFSIEVNPDDVSEEFLKDLEKIGINRISCGIQSLNDEVLKKCRRRALKKENLQALNLIKKNWKQKKSFDLISALPLETESTFLDGIKTVLEYEPDHVSLYSLTIEDETPFGKDFLLGNLKYDFDNADKMWLSGRDFLEKNGLFQYEISNFSKDKKSQCVHNLVYWSHKSYIGCGAGAASSLYDSDGSCIRLSNVNSIQKYIEFYKNPDFKKNYVEISEKIDVETSVFEYFMMKLRTIYGVSKYEFNEIFNKNSKNHDLIEFPKKVEKVFYKWSKDFSDSVNIFQTEDGDTHFLLTKKGMLFLNRFLLEL